MKTLSRLIDRNPALPKWQANQLYMFTVAMNILQLKKQV